MDSISDCVWLSNMAVFNPRGRLSYLQLVVLLLVPAFHCGAFTIRPTWNLQMCLGAYPDSTASGDHGVALTSCGNGGHVDWAYNSHGYIGPTDMTQFCLDGVLLTPDDGTLRITTCCTTSPTQRWTYDDGLLKNSNNQCFCWLTNDFSESTHNGLGTCDSTNPLCLVTFV